MNLVHGIGVSVARVKRIAAWHCTELPNQISRWAVSRRRKVKPVMNTRHPPPSALDAADTPGTTRTPRTPQTPRTPYAPWIPRTPQTPQTPRTRRTPPTHLRLALDVHKLVKLSRQARLCSTLATDAAPGCGIAQCRPRRWFVTGHRNLGQSLAYVRRTPPR